MPNVALNNFDENAKILIVDDVPANLLALSAILEELDTEIYQANSGNEALSLVLEHDFSMVLLDVQMPEMDGYEVAKIMRSYEKTKHVPIIFLTANSRGRENYAKGYSVGAIDYIEKPIDEEFLLAKVRVFKELDDKSRALAFHQRKTEITLGAIPDPVICVHDDDIVYMNEPAKALSRVFGCGENCCSLPDLFSFDQNNLQNIQKFISSVNKKRSAQPPSAELTFHLPGSTKNLVFEFRLVPLLGENETTTETILIFHDISNLRSLSQELSFQAFHDSLTRLSNRRYLESIFPKVQARHARSGKNMAIMLIDLDNFKRVNDTGGHHAGDSVLCEAAERIQSCLRDVDTLCRIGGDEFCVLLEDVESVEFLKIPAQRIIDKVAGKYVIDKEEYEIGASIGITSTLIDEEDNLTCILTDADLAMYKAKQDGKNGYCLFTVDMRKELNRKIRLDKELINAIEKSEFRLFYQPQVSIKTGNVVGLEALIRWQHSERGEVQPNDFISVLETTGLIKMVGKWVIEEACRQIAQWQSAGFDVPCVSVNVSPKQFEEKGLPDFIRSTMKKYNVKPESLGIEITESLFMGLTVQVENNLNAIHEMGCKISMDDFGTGYSSLSYLMRFPIDVIKIDQSFIRDLVSLPRHQDLVKTIVSLGHGFNNMRVIAEGVETISVLSMLKDMKCDSYQGFLHSKPMPAKLVQKRFSTIKPALCAELKKLKLYH